MKEKIFLLLTLLLHFFLLVSLNGSSALSAKNFFLLLMISIKNSNMTLLIKLKTVHWEKFVSLLNCFYLYLKSFAICQG